jgi:AmmeMemoRadiSam system protein A
MLVGVGACAPRVEPPNERIDRVGRTQSEWVAKEAKVKETRSGEWSPALTAEEKEALFAIATDTLAWCVGGRKGSFDWQAYTLTPKLKVPMATFVTLKMGGQLRGCIGSLAPAAPLYESVHDNAINASLNDYRFRPVTAAELKRIDVDISILSPIEDIASRDDFKIGEHGIILRKGMHRAVYLPEVALEQKWTVEQTLSSLSQKAGMPPDAWQEGTSFQVFSSVVLAMGRESEQ